jgi:hypothetical protein
MTEPTTRDGETGICGHQAPQIVNGPPVFCALRAGHIGWHGDGQASWGQVFAPPAPDEFATLNALGDARKAAEELREELLEAARGWILRHSSQPGGDRWADDPDHLAWAAENLLCDLAPWLRTEADDDARSWQQAVDWHAGYEAGRTRTRRRLLGRFRRALDGSEDGA